MVMGGTEMTCFAECHLPSVMLRREQGGAFFVCEKPGYLFFLFGSVHLTSNSCASCLYRT